MKRVKFLVLLLILMLSCSTTVYASDWMKSPLKSDYTDMQWDTNFDGEIDAREAAIRDAKEEQVKELGDIGTDEDMQTIAANKSASALNTVCYLAGLLLIISAVILSILYLADYVTDGRYCILSFLTKRRYRYQNTNIWVFLCKMLAVAVVGVFIANGTFQMWLNNLYAYILEYLN